VFLPAIDEKQPATLSRRILDLLRTDLAFQGLILSDDLEMKAIANAHPVPEAAVMAVEAGCDGVLICGTDHDVQAAALEALVHAVEGERLPYAKMDRILARQRRVRERFAGSILSRPPAAGALRQVLGCDRHRAIADEMARFV
jgi:beta-N-acetylhexosaminidase